MKYEKIDYVKVFGELMEWERKEHGLLNVVIVKNRGNTDMDQLLAKDQISLHLDYLSGNCREMNWEDLDKNDKSDFV